MYLTGIVRDKQGRKMSKSLGNSPDPIDLIEKYGADGVRTGMLFSSPAGNDLPFDEKLCEQGRNFSNKIWNAFRLVKGWEVADTAAPVGNQTAVRWFRAKASSVILEVAEHYDKFRMSDALLATYNLIWNDFCSQYLEMVKPAYIQGQAQPIDRETYEATIAFFDELMRLVHPWTPFISEEIWQQLAKRPAQSSICLAPFPVAGEVDNAILQDIDVVTELVSWVRNTRNAKQLSPKEALPLVIKTSQEARYSHLLDLIQKLANTASIQFADQISGVSLVIKADEFGLDLGDNLDVETEKENLQKELDYTIGFQKSVLAKLSNERFVQNAKPDVVQREKDKLADAESKIAALQEALSKLK